MYAGYKRTDNWGNFQLGSQEIFQLRGFILCPRCGKILTASASRGRNGKYHYYHCNAACGTRFKSENANELFVRELKKFVPRPAMKSVYSLVINDVYSSRTKYQRDDIQNFKNELEKVHQKLNNARELLMNNILDASDYKIIKSDCERRLQVLEVKLVDASEKTVYNIESLIRKAIDSLTSLDELYIKADVKKKRQIIGSIYPEKLTFDGFHYRTIRLNEAVELIYKLGEGFSENDTGEIDVKTNFSCLVDPYGFEP
jgi:site-specific DNA recombinase